jgi:SAM-dependent methyltransferase
MDESETSRWARLGGVPRGEEYAERFAALERSGVDVHGEATFCAGLVPPSSTVLDAGCGTGRVAIRLHELGYSCVGTDVDDSMLAVARAQAPEIPWHHADLTSLTADDLGGASGFDLVVLAGNVVPLLGEGTLGSTMHCLADLLAGGGLLIAGFGLDAAHLPPGCPVTTLEEYDAACVAAGLELRERHSGWDREPYSDVGYAVSVSAVR